MLKFFKAKDEICQPVDTCGWHPVARGHRVARVGGLLHNPSNSLALLTGQTQKRNPHLALGVIS